MNEYKDMNLKFFLWLCQLRRVKLFRIKIENVVFQQIEFKNFTVRPLSPKILVYSWQCWNKKDIMKPHKYSQIYVNDQFAYTVGTYCWICVPWMTSEQLQTINNDRNFVCLKGGHYPQAWLCMKSLNVYQDSNCRSLKHLNNKTFYLIIKSYVYKHFDYFIKFLILSNIGSTCYYYNIISQNSYCNEDQK